MSGAGKRRGQRGQRGRRGEGDGLTSDSSSFRGGSTRGVGLPAPPGAFDGPASSGSASGPASAGRRGSNPPSVGSTPQSGPTSPPLPQQVFTPMPGSGPSSRRGSVVGTPQGGQPQGGQSQGGQPQSSQAVVKQDPAKENPARFTDQFKNIDLSAAIFNVDGLYQNATEFKLRPGYNTSGKPIQVAINSYPVTQFPTVQIYQYDVQIGSGAEKRVVIKKVWESETRKSKTGPQILFDGNKLAWTSAKANLPAEIRFEVDLDDEKARSRRTAGTSNSFRVVIRRTKTLDISSIQSYLSRRSGMTTNVLEAINFLDHMLREYPSTSGSFITIKRSLFTRNGQRMNLGQGVEVFRGVYQSLRMAEGQKLVVNLDVANTCFWQPQSLTAAIMSKFKLRDVQQIVRDCRPLADNGSRRASPQAKLYAKSFKKVLVKAVYQGNPFPKKEWNIKDFRLENAKEFKFPWQDPNTGVERQISTFEYFKAKYNLNIVHWQLPLVEMTKKNVMYPMELLHIIDNQRYPFKLDETQTANMIKFAVSPPAIREKAINEGKSWLNWEKDPVLNSFGLKIDPNMMKTNARLLAAPGVKFGNSVTQPGTKGRWDLRGKKFLSGNPVMLEAWGVGAFTNGRFTVNRGQIDQFVQEFVRIYRQHGGQVSNKPPHVMLLPNDPANAVEALHQATGNSFQRRPQLMIFFVQDKNSFHYTRIKKSCDCRYGVVSQVMQMAQMAKCNPQYISNVLMKVNAKLGGTTTQSVPSPNSGFKGTFNEPTMLIGADVSHASPGSPQASMAALTVSFDKTGSRYAAVCQTNGHRVEMIAESTFVKDLAPLVSHWQSQVGQGRLPSQVYYFRDGVSEGQFIHLLNQEVRHLRSMLSTVNKAPWNGKITVVVASKRHHIRAFPQPGGPAADTKGNALPGCLIEHDCTTPFEWDFYLYSHIALQGTSRPVHYTIVQDDANHAPNVIQNMIYEHCYQYMRSTTSVSLFPAVYYAHLASNRARAHEDIPSSEGPQGGPGFKQNVQSSDSATESETKELMKLFPVNNIQYAMWYI